MLRFLTAGESHGPQLTAILEGMIAGLPLEMTCSTTWPAVRQATGAAGACRLSTTARASPPG